MKTITMPLEEYQEELRKVRQEGEYEAKAHLYPRMMSFIRYNTGGNPFEDFTIKNGERFLRHYFDEAMAERIRKEISNTALTAIDPLKSYWIRTWDPTLEKFNHGRFTVNEIVAGAQALHMNMVDIGMVFLNIEREKLGLEKLDTSLVASHEPYKA